MLAPLPQLFPHLDKRLNLLRSRDSIVDESAVLMRALVELPHSGQAQVCEVVTNLLEVLLAQHFRFAFIRAAGYMMLHHSTFVFYSPKENVLR